MITDHSSHLWPLVPIFQWFPQLIPISILPLGSDYRQVNQARVPPPQQSHLAFPGVFACSYQYFIHILLDLWHVVRNFELCLAHLFVYRVQHLIIQGNRLFLIPLWLHLFLVVDLGANVLWPSRLLRPIGILSQHVFVSYLIRLWDTFGLFGSTPAASSWGGSFVPGFWLCWWFLGCDLGPVSNHFLTSISYDLSLDFLLVTPSAFMPIPKNSEVQPYSSASSSSSWSLVSTLIFIFPSFLLRGLSLLLGTCFLSSFIFSSFSFTS